MKFVIAALLFIASAQTVSAEALDIQIMHATRVISAAFGVNLRPDERLSSYVGDNGCIVQTEILGGKKTLNGVIVTVAEKPAGGLRVYFVLSLASSQSAHLQNNFGQIAATTSYRNPRMTSARRQSITILANNGKNSVTVTDGEKTLTCSGFTLQSGGLE